MFRVKRNVLICIGVILLLVISFIIFIIKIPSPPSIELSKARIELNKAEVVKSKLFAKYQYILAKNYYDSAYLEWKSQNYHFILNRNYSKVLFYAGKSFIHSKESKSLAIANSRDIKIYLKNKIKEIGNFYEQYDSLIRNLPLNDNIKNIHHTSKMALSEAKIALKSDDLNMTMKKIVLSEETLEKTKYQVSSELTEYFKRYHHWKDASESAIRTSRQRKNTVIVVDKFAKKCFVYNKGILKHIFNIELGKNWIGTKNIQNDKATPEGIYKVEKKLNHSQTKYYKALLINYPNKEDESRFKLAKKKGEIPKDADIGGFIEIHGNGGKGANWTNGCVALKNEDMDQLFDLARNGTQVVIVGSLSKLSDIIDF